MRDQSMEEACVLLFSGRTTFNEFAQATRTHWWRLARHICKWWPPPGWMTIADVAQELLLGAHLHIWRFDASRGVAIGKFTVWNAMSEAKYAVHAARGVSLHGNPDRVKRGNVEKPLSSYIRAGSSADDADHFIEGLLLARGVVTEATQEEDASQMQAVERALRACTSDAERAAVEALAEAKGDFAEAARAVCANDRARKAVGIRGRAKPDEHETAAARAVVRCVSDVAVRLLDVTAA